MTTSRSVWTDLAAVLSLGAGLVHAAAAGTHAGDSTLVALFAGAALLQGALGALLLGSPNRRTLAVIVAVNLAAVGAWALSRTTGLAVIASLSGRESVGLQDLSAVALAAGAATFGLVALARARDVTSRAQPGWVLLLALLPALVGVTAPHTHSDSHSHGHGEEVHEDAGTHDHDAPAPVATASSAWLAGADTTDATDQEIDAAATLVETTRAAVDPAMTVAAAEAAGYVWIGDGRRPGGFQHYINHAYLADDIDLDPDRVESLVFESTEAGPVLVSTMYVLGLGSTMDDVPDVAGDLTVWHDHQNLCWDATGTRLAGISVDGETCRPGGELRPTPPMLHVWLADNECGPFAGIEGHGDSGCASHEH